MVVPTRSPVAPLAWMVLAACCALTAIGRGMVESFVVFLLPLAQAFEWSRGEVVRIFALTVLVNGTSGLPVGWLVDRAGQRLVYSLGLAALASAFLAAPFLTELWQFKLVIGVAVGFGAACLGGVAHMPLLARLFPGRTGLALGLIFASVGTGVLVIVPATQAVIEAAGWAAGYRAQALMALCLLPIVWLIPLKRLAREHPAAKRSQLDGTGFFRALTERGFWGLTGVYFFTSAAMFAIAPQIVAYLIEIGFEALFAATSFGIAGFISAIGITSAGTLSDRIGHARVVGLSFAMTATGLLLLLALEQAPSVPLLGLFIFVYGLSSGTRGPIVSSMAARLFAGPRLGAIYGAITCGYGFGAALGAFIGGWIYDWTGGYQAIIGYAIVCCALGFAAFQLVPVRDQR